MRENSAFSKFEKSVFQSVQKIPCGKVSTYREVAKAAGNERAWRAVGNALAKNPFPVLVPCHRVVRSDLHIGNFSLGMRMKKKMLEGEGAEFTGWRVKKEFLIKL